MVSTFLGLGLSLRSALATMVVSNSKCRAVSVRIEIPSLSLSLDLERRGSISDLMNCALFRNPFPLKLEVSILDKASLVSLSFCA